jgi:hypothetical protein
MKVERQQLFNCSGTRHLWNFELLASKCISWESPDQVLAVQVCQQLYTEYEKVYRVLEREKEEKWGLL